MKQARQLASSCNLTPNRYFLDLWEGGAHTWVAPEPTFLVMFVVEWHLCQKTVWPSGESYHCRDTFVLRWGLTPMLHGEFDSQSSLIVVHTKNHIMCLH